MQNDHHDILHFWRLQERFESTKSNALKKLFCSMLSEALERLESAKSNALKTFFCSMSSEVLYIHVKQKIFDLVYLLW